MQDLGRLVHLIQDATSPAHTRGDPHIGPTVSGVHGFNYESLVRRIQLDADVEKNGPTAAFFDQLVAPLRPQPGWEALDGNPLAPVPIARLLDADRYDGSNPGVTLGGVIGLAEYGNANYFSEDRTFPETSGFPFPAHTSVSVQDYAITLPDGSVVTRQYYRKDRDGDTGYRLATVGFLRDYHVRYNLDPGRFDQKVALDEEVYRDYAMRLVPRAVGYSAALLDYFFRGRLDVDLVEDPNDPALLKISGTNASPDRMDGGLLTLYADAPDGSRMAAVPVDPADPALSVTADAGGAIESARFIAPADAERFVAVYRGKLGHEVPVVNDDPALGFPGAVIGKVLGGVRVEQVFNDGIEWKVRTPQGILPLREGDKALTWGDFQRIKWGEADSQLVAMTAFGPGQPNRLVAFDVPRKPGSADLDTTDTAQGRVVRLTRRQEAPFPVGLALGTTVQLAHAVDYRQVFLMQDQTDVYAWQPTFPETPQYDNFNYKLLRIERTPVTPETMVEGTPALTSTVVPTLAVDRYQAGDDTKANANWLLDDFVLAADGRFLATVAVTLTAPPLSTRPWVEFPVYEFFFSGPRPEQVCDPTCHDRLARFYQQVPAAGRTLLWALVDVSHAQLLASTAGALITVASREVVRLPDLTSAVDPRRVVYGQRTIRREGGPRPSVTGPEPLVGQLRVWDGKPFEQASDLTIDVGGSLIVSGELRGDLRAALGAAGDPGGPSRSYWQWSIYGPSEHQYLLRVAPSPSPPQQPGTTIYSFSCAPAARGDRCVLVGNAYDFAGGAGYIDTLAVWDPSSGTASAPVRVANSGEVSTDLRVGAVTGEAALVSAPSHATGFVVPLDATTPLRTFADDAGLSSFTLLAPRYLYNQETLRFFRGRPPLQETALPAQLADVGYTVWDGFHAIRLP